MKYFFIFLISLYQIALSPFLNQLGGGCRYEESCSRFAKRQILEKGVLEGSRQALKRFASCHPFAKVHTEQV